MDAIQLDKGGLRELIACLADGAWHSGEELGGVLGVSRAAVWKQLQKLQALGLDVSSQKGRGYAIVGGLDLLREEAVLHELALLQQSRLQQLFIFPLLDSTNSFLLREGVPHAAACVAEVQTAGRGRRGRCWQSPFAQNIYFSLGWHFDGGIAALEGLSLAVGVVLADALERLGFLGVELKWPNDILINNEKLAGILIEISGDPNGNCQAVIGIGVNVAMSNSAATGIEQPWTDLSQLALQQNIPLPTRNRLLAYLLDAVVELLADYERSGFAAYRRAWEARNAFAEKFAVLSSPASQLHGLVLGVNEQGALRLQTEQGEIICHGGELSLRAMA